ncbi:E-selectin-like [Branchiostoma floridae x Branchiostoma belcheri]
MVATGYNNWLNQRMYEGFSYVDATMKEPPLRDGPPASTPSFHAGPAPSPTPMMQIRSGNDGAKISFPLGENVFATVGHFRGKPTLSVRHFYRPRPDQEDVWKGGKKGIVLTPEQWRTLKREMSGVSSALLASVQCPARAAPANGAVTPTGAVSYPNGVTFTCNSGYVRNGAASATCQADGKWSDPVPTCNRVQCPGRAAPANGALTSTGVVFYPNGVVFSCNSGFTLNGQATPTCQADGTWSHPVPTCSPRQCPALTAPPFGVLRPIGARSYQDTVTFECDQGYTLNGATSATCQADETWSNPVPTCTPVQCPARAAPANGAVTPTGAVSYPNGVTFTCNSGYTLNGQATPTCQADGTWSHPAPTCQGRPDLVGCTAQLQQ